MLHVFWKNRNFEIMPVQVLITSKIDLESTKIMFRTAYSIAKNQKLYVDILKLVDFKIINGL